MYKTIVSLWFARRNVFPDIVYALGKSKPICLCLLSKPIKQNAPVILNICKIFILQIENLIYGACV